MDSGWIVTIHRERRQFLRNTAGRLLLIVTFLLSVKLYHALFSAFDGHRYRAGCRVVVQEALGVPDLIVCSRALTLLVAVGPDARRIRGSFSDFAPDVDLKRSSLTGIRTQCRS